MITWDKSFSDLDRDYIEWRDSIALRLIAWIWTQIWSVVKIALGIYLAMRMIGA
jgi:hypothetical protein